MIFNSCIIKLSLPRWNILFIIDIMNQQIKSILWDTLLKKFLMKYQASLNAS